MSRPCTALLLLVASQVVGCGGDDDTDAAPGDGAGPDALVVAPADVPWLEDGVPPIAIAPCPGGWREVDDGGVTTCDPYPEGGALECPDGEAHFPGEPGCAPVGSPCPSGDYSESLPADARVVYVQPGATGGDGMSPTTPYGSVGEIALGGLPMGSVIALSRGTHVGPVRLTRGLALWGACAAETVMTTPEPSETEGVVTFVGAGVLHDLSVRDSPRPGVRLVLDGAEGTVDGVWVSGAQLAGVFVSRGGLTAEALVVRGTRGSATDGAFGRGLNVQSGATATLSGVLLEDNHEFGVFGDGAGTALTLTDAVVRRTEGLASDASFGRGLNVQGGATADLSGVLLEDNLDFGVFGGGVGTAVTLSDVVVRRTESQASDGTSGRGLSVQSGATATLSRVLLEDNHDVGVYGGGAGTAVTLSDVVVRRTGSEASDGTGGRGLSVQRGATAALTEVLLEDNRDVGVFGDGEGTAVMLTDVVVRGTESEASDGTSGRGVGVQFGSAATLSRVLVEDNREIGVYGAAAGTTVALSDVVVRDMRPRACAETTCPDAPAGHGVGATDSASLSLARFVVERSYLCGVFLARDGRVDLMEGEVRENPIGVCLQVDGYDTDRLTGSVRFLDNESNLQTTDLPVPEPAEVLPDP